MNLENKIAYLKTHYCPPAAANTNAEHKARNKIIDKELAKVITELFSYNEPNEMQDTIYKLPDLGYTTIDIYRTHANAILREITDGEKDGFWCYGTKNDLYLMHHLIFEKFGAGETQYIKLNGSLILPHEPIYDEDGNIVTGTHQKTIVTRVPTDYYNQANLPRIFERIDAGLKDDYVDPGTHQVWMVKKYLAGESMNYVELWNPAKTKLIGRAYRTVSEAIEANPSKANQHYNHISRNPLFCRKSNKMED